MICDGRRRRSSRLGCVPICARRERLRALRGRSPAVRWLAAAATIAAVSVAFTFPEVRAGAAAFLDLFRVVNFAGVRFDPQRLAGLKAGGVDLPSLLGDIEPLTEPTPPVSYADPREAGQAAGIELRLPAWVPPGWALDRDDGDGRAFRARDGEHREASNGARRAGAR